MSTGTDTDTVADLIAAARNIVDVALHYNPATPWKGQDVAWARLILATDAAEDHRGGPPHAWTDPGRGVVIGWADRRRCDLCGHRPDHLVHTTKRG